MWGPLYLFDLIMSTPRAAKHKVAFTGTNSSGKTTMALEVTARLKRQYHVLAEVVSSQDRKITWNDAHFPIRPEAHFGMISNLVHAEVAASLKGDATIVVTDRSVLDLYAIAKTDFPEHPKIHKMEGYILAWLETYDKIFYLPPLEYQEDGKRPPNEFRLRTHATLLELIDKYQLPNVVKQDRADSFKSILDLLGISPAKEVYAEKEKWQAVSNELGVTVMVKRATWPSTSDHDVWLLLDRIDQFDGGILVSKAKYCAALYFGTQLTFDFLVAPIEVLNAGTPKGGVVCYRPQVKPGDLYAKTI